MEIHGIRRRLAQLRAEQAAPTLIEEYEVQLHNLVALYEAATTTLEQGRADRRLPKTLLELGFGEWTLENVYSFVYEAAMESEDDGRALANIINSTDWAASLVAASEA